MKFDKEKIFSIIANDINTFDSITFQYDDAWGTDEDIDLIMDKHNLTAEESFYASTIMRTVKTDILAVAVHGADAAASKAYDDYNAAWVATYDSIVAEERKSILDYVSKLMHINA